MKICLLGDTHFGARNDHLAFHDHFELFYKDVLFPYLEQNDIDTVIQFGDLFDRRKYINFGTLYRSRKYFFDPLREKGIKLHVFVGNHDTFFKNSNTVNAPGLLLTEYDNVYVYDTPETVGFDGVDIALLPWVNTGNLNDCMEFIDTTSAQILFGHLELAGFEMYRGSVHDHGMDANIFGKFDIVCSGHFHHKSTRGNIHYLGTPYEMTWSDYDDTRGFHVFDTDTRQISFVRNPYRMFHKVYYDDSDKTMEEILDFDYSGLQNTFVKVVVKNKTNPYWFDMFINKLERVGLVNLQVVDDHLNLNIEDDSGIAGEAEDTITILKKVIAGIETQTVSKKKLEVFLVSLYNEALQQE